MQVVIAGDENEEIRVHLVPDGYGVRLETIEGREILTLSDRGIDRIGGNDKTIGLPLDTDGRVKLVGEE